MGQRQADWHDSWCVHTGRLRYFTAREGGELSSSCGKGFSRASSRSPTRTLSAQAPAREVLQRFPRLRIGIAVSVTGFDGSPCIDLGVSTRADVTTNAAATAPHAFKNSRQPRFVATT